MLGVRGHYSVWHCMLCLGVLLGALCSAYASCPAACTCSSDLTEARCSAAGLTAVPDDLPATLTLLMLNDNHISELNETSLQGLSSLRSLHAGNNSLQSVAQAAFSGLKSLRELHLPYNELTDTALLSLHAGMQELTTLDLSHNNIQWDLDTLTASNQDTAADPPQDMLIALNSSHNMPNDTSQYIGLPGLAALISLPNLEVLDLSFNAMQVFPVESFSRMPSLHQLNLSHNSLVSIQGDHSTLTVLDVSWNSISSLNTSAMHVLQQLNLAHNKLSQLPLVHDLSSLISLDLSHNQFTILANSSFSGCRSLRELQMDSLERLWLVEPGLFNGLSNLQLLSMAQNRDLRSLPEALFSPLTSVETIDLRGGALIHVPAAVFAGLDRLRGVWLGGSPWMCDCHITWLHAALLANASTPTFQDADSITCAHPVHLQGLPLVSLSSDDLTCSAPVVQHTVQYVRFIVSLPAVLDCLADGRPHPHIMWVTPAHTQLHYDPATGSQGMLPPEQDEYHAKHTWHDSSIYQRRLSANQRVHVLRNGSLYIDYVKRNDAGTYRCHVQNHAGNVSAAVVFTLNYDSILDTYVFSLAAGAACAACFLLIGLTLGLVRRTVNKCSKKRKEKRNQFGQIMGNINTYSANQFDKLSAYKSYQLGRLADYKTLKVDQLSAFKSAKVDKLSNYRKITLSNIVNHYHVMAGHYSAAVERIHVNCTNSADKIRDHYATNVGSRIKMPRCERVRDNYSAQMLRVREYGSTQMERLREQYKTQQQHLVKLLEIMDVGNCLTVIEAECLHTESMIFDPDFKLDFALHPVHIPRGEFGDSESEYETASNSSRQPGTLEEEELPDFPDPDMPDLPDLPDISEITGDLYQAENIMLDVSNGLPTVIIKTPKSTPNKHPHHHHKRRHRHRSEGGEQADLHSSQENLAADPNLTRPRKRKHRKHRRRKESDQTPAAAAGEATAKKSRHRNKSAKSVDGNAPQTNSNAHIMNISLGDNNHPASDDHSGEVSEYASAAQSREQTPKIEVMSPAVGQDVVINVEDQESQLRYKGTESAV